MSQNNSTIRPAARLLKTIGQDLIKDVYAAIVELVKNAYDADSPDVTVSFDYSAENQRLLISVEDHGHGMDYDTVVGKWLVPATDDKLLRKKSERGRVLQGRKGIGRFAAAILGERILLETTSNGWTTSLILDMDELDRVQFLDQLQLNIETEKTNKNNGTVIEIEKDGVSSDDVRTVWNPKQLRKLFVELRSLTAPDEVYQIASDQGFEIDHDAFDMHLNFRDFPIEEYSNQKIKIKPFPVLDLYDYKISGKIDSSGNANLSFNNQNVPSIAPEKISLKVPIPEGEKYKYPGDIYIDMRVYDRDSDSIENIINRGLKDPDTGEYLGKMEARKVLDEYYGVGIYREQFRIRPYGEQGFDWLELDKMRVQNPSFRIGHNQVIGFIYVRPEEISGLQEKSARDGLVENEYYFGLTTLVAKVVNELEARRYNYREKALRGGRKRTIEDDIDSLFDFDSTRNQISKELDEMQLKKNDRENFEAVVSKVLKGEKQKKSEYARRIRDTIAIYQGQATLGKITHVLLHEGRKHIKYISETLPRIKKWALQISESRDSEKEKLLTERSEKIIAHAKGLSFLFTKIEPLARTRRSPKKNISLISEIENSLAIFSSELNDSQIQHHLDISDRNLIINANEMDVITIFSNLIENSIFWLSQIPTGKRQINISVFEDGKNIVVEFSDTGPGFQGSNLELMFDPGYSMKPNGTGLGLALAGEAMSRIGGAIRAKQADKGAIFELTFEEAKK